MASWRPTLVLTFLRLECLRSSFRTQAYDPSALVNAAAQSAATTSTACSWATESRIPQNAQNEKEGALITAEFSVWASYKVRVERWSLFSTSTCAWPTSIRKLWDQTAQKMCHPRGEPRLMALRCLSKSSICPDWGVWSAVWRWWNAPPGKLGSKLSKPRSSEQPWGPRCDLPTNMSDWPLWGPVRRRFLFIILCLGS